MCDAERQKDFYEMQQLAFLSMLVSGDVFALFGMKPNMRNPYQTVIRLIEADRVSTPESTGESTAQNNDAGGRTVDGIEMNKDGEVVKTTEAGPVEGIRIVAEADTAELVEENTYDMALVRVRATDDRGNVLPFFNEPLLCETNGPLEIVGPKITVFRGGMTGLLVRTAGEAGRARVILTAEGAGRTEVRFEVKCTEDRYEAEAAED